MRERREPPDHYRLRPVETQLWLSGRSRRRLGGRLHVQRRLQGLTHQRLASTRHLSGQQERGFSDDFRRGVEQYF